MTLAVSIGGHSQTAYLKYDSMTMRLNTFDLALEDPAHIPALGDAVSATGPAWSGTVTAVKSSDPVDRIGHVRYTISCTNTAVIAPSTAPFNLSDAPDGSTTFGYRGLAVQVQSNTDATNTTTGSCTIEEPGLWPGMTFALTSTNQGYSGSLFTLTDVSVSWPVEEQPAYELTFGDPVMTFDQWVHGSKVGAGVISWNADDVLAGTPPAGMPYGSAGSTGPAFWVNGHETDMTVSFYPSNHVPFDVAIPSSAFVTGDNVLAVYIWNDVFASDWAHNPTMFRFRLQAGPNVINSGVDTTSLKFLPVEHGSGPTTINALPADWMLQGFDDSGWADAVTMSDDGHWPLCHVAPNDYAALFVTPDGPTGTLDTSVLDGLHWVLRAHFTLGPGVPIINPIRHKGGLIVGAEGGTPVELPLPSSPGGQLLTIDPGTGVPAWKPSGRSFQFFGG